MKISKSTISFIMAWILVNAGFFICLSSNHDKTKTEIILAPEIVNEFESLPTPNLTDISKDSVTLRARLLKPERVERRKAYPLIVSLHGAGERGNDNRQQLKFLPQQMVKPPCRETFPCFVLAPQCPRDMHWSSPVIQADTPAGEEKLLLDQIHQLILDICSKYPIDQQRIYVTGYSMGGFGTWSMIARYPELFAAAVPICGGGNPETVSRFSKMPIWIAHGDADQTIPVASSRRMVEALQQVGSSPVYVELRGVAHDSWTPTYNEQSGMMEWLFKQRRSPGSSH